VRLMLGVARRHVGGLVATIQHPDDQLAGLAMDDSGAKLLVWGQDKKVATLWECLPAARQPSRSG